MRQMHTGVAIALILVFLATGGYMRATFPEAYQGNETMRMLFRSAHVYILMTALVNGAYGVNYSPEYGWRGVVQHAGSAALLLSPFVMTAAFFLETSPDRLDRPMILSGAILALAGVLLVNLAGYHRPQVS